MSNLQPAFWCFCPGLVFTDMLGAFLFMSIKRPWLNVMWMLRCMAVEGSGRRFNWEKGYFALLVIRHRLCCVLGFVTKNNNKNTRIYYALWRYYRPIIVSNDNHIYQCILMSRVTVDVTVAWWVPLLHHTSRIALFGWNLQVLPVFVCRILYIWFYPVVQQHAASCLESPHCL